MTDRVESGDLAEVVAAAMISGPASRTDLLAAAVAARAPTLVLETFLRLPERCYHDADDLHSALATPSRTHEGGS